MAGAAGAAVVMYYTGWDIPWGVFKAQSYNALGEEDTSDEGEGDLFVGGIARKIGKRRVVVPIIARAPSTWFESLSTISETLRFTYSETLGKWPIGDLAFGINYLLKHQSHEHVAKAFAIDGSKQIDGLNMLSELREYLRVLIMCMHFSKKPFPLFLEAIGFNVDQVLLEEGKAGILKPAFTVLLDHKNSCILLLIRGTHSVKDTLTSLTGAVVPFHHTILKKDGVSKLILGYAHCGMVAAARWIATSASQKISKAFKDHPSYQLKIVGHSLGGGTAALLSYILREQNICSSICCICFGPAACMTKELAESGSEFVITIINECDLVPCFSSGSLDDLRAEVTASPWAHDFREQIKQTRILRTMFRSASALRCRLQTFAGISQASTSGSSSVMVSRACQTGAPGFGAIWRPVSNGTWCMMKQAIAAVRTPSLMNWVFTKRKHCNMDVVASSTQVSDIPTNTCNSSNNVGVLEPHDKNTLFSKPTLLDDTMKLLPSASSSNQHESVDKTSNECTSLNESNDLMEETATNLPQLSNATGDINDTIAQLEVQDELDQVEEPTSPNSRIEGIGEDLLWHQVAQELERQQYIAKVETQCVHEEEAEIAKEIIKEEENVISNVTNEIEKEETKPAVQIDNMRHFYPPGQIIHMVVQGPIKLDNQEGNCSNLQQKEIGLYLTQRSVYKKIRLSRTMVHDHYMPTYKYVIESIIEHCAKKSIE
ncbi:uncharacterized protein [Physcomitrium patens]